MPYPRRLINEGETVALDLHPHWWFYAAHVLSLVLLAGALAALLSLATGEVRQYGLYAVAGASALWLVWLGARYAVWRTTHFVVTSDRLIYRYGVLSRHGREIPLERVNDISFHQTLWERIVGAGDLLIESAGERGQQTFTDIAHPDRVQQEIYRQIEANTKKTAGYGRGEATIPEQIAQLADLRDRGLITAAEFETKKQQLLERM